MDISKAPKFQIKQGRCETKVSTSIQVNSEIDSSNQDFNKFGTLSIYSQVLMCACAPIERGVHSFFVSVIWHIKHKRF